MTDSGSPTRKPRLARRPLLAGLLSASLIAVVWMLWPSADPRLVGRWRKLETNADPARPALEFVLLANGSGHSHRGEKQVLPVTWRVEGPILHMELGRNVGLLGLIERCQNWVNQVRGKFVVPTFPSRFYLIEVLPDRFTYSPLASDEQVPGGNEARITFVRIPD